MKIIHGDCLEELKKMNSQMMDLVVTSPPYNMRTRIRNGEYTTREKSEHFSKKYAEFGDDLPIEDYYKFHKEVLQELLRVSKTIIYNFQVVTGSKEAMFKIIGDYSRNIKDVVVWDKGHGQPSMHDGVLNRATELILILESDAKAGRCFNRSYFPRGILSDIWRVPRERNDYEGHGAMMPIELARIAIENFSKVGDTILDPFCGMATTGVACQELNRNFIGIELMEKYVELGTRRLNSTPKGLF